MGLAAFNQVKVCKVKRTVRYHHRADMLLHLHIRHILLGSGKIKYTVPVSHGPQRPFLIDKRVHRRISVVECLCLKCDIQISTHIYQKCSAVLLALSKTLGVFKLIVEISPQLSVCSGLRDKSNRC